MTLDEVPKMLNRSRLRVLDLCKRAELPFKPGAQVLNDRDEVSAPVASALQALAGWREWIRTNRRAAAAWFTDIVLDFPSTVVAGRRDGAGADQKQQLAELNDSLVGTRIRTYDWLIARLDEGRTR